MSKNNDFESIHASLEQDPERPLTMMQRRRFLQGALVLGTSAASLPTFFADQASAQSGTDTILVTVTLAGGNDGLNTFGPFANGRYKDLRKHLAISQTAAHAGDAGYFFHPNMRRLATRFRRGDVAVVQGVGEPLKDRSHFSNLARWQSANPNGVINGTGWVGRYLDASPTSQFTGIAIGGQGVPLHFRGASSEVTDLPRGGGALYGADRSNPLDQRMYRAIRQMGQPAGRPSWVNAVGDVNAQSIDAAQSVADAFKTELPEEHLLSDMVLAARVINLNLGTRVLNVWQGGYDTHDNQIAGHSGIGEHADLLNELDVSLDTFFATLTPAMAERVVVMVYSEFGRRAELNGSNGTDHGTSSNVFMIGRRISGGIFGDPPPLNQLDDRGDFRVTKDFRSVYATVLDDGLGAAPNELLGQGYSQIQSMFLPPQAPESALATRARQIRERRQVNPDDYLIHSAPTF